MAFIKESHRIRQPFVYGWHRVLLLKERPKTRKGYVVLIVVMPAQLIVPLFFFLNFDLPLFHLQFYWMNSIFFITGATAGIGEACAEKFASAKYDLVAGRRVVEDSKPGPGLKSNVVKVQTACFDVRDKNCFEKTAALPDDWKQIDIL